LLEKPTFIKRGVPMPEFDGTPVLQPPEWFAEEIVVASSNEDAEIIVLELAVAMQVLEKHKRLSKE
jgi:hypothetical protein